MDKNKKELQIVAMALVAKHVYEMEQKEGVCGIRTHYNYDGLHMTSEPSVHLLKKEFFEYFGDTEFEYVEDKDGDEEMQVRINGVLFFALVN